MKLPGIVIGMTVAIAISQGAYAQADPLLGTWVLNHAKSTFSRGAQVPSRSSIIYQAVESHHTATAEITDAQGRTSRVVFTHVYDGQPHPTAGAAHFNASSYTRLDANTVIFTRIKDGKLVGVGSGVVSIDGKTLTFAGTGASGYGPSGNYVTVFEKQ